MFAPISLLLAVIFWANSAQGAVHNDVNTDGSTKGPGYTRPEGLTTSYCPQSHPFACGGGSYCTANIFKPQNATSDCDGQRVNLYSTCCPGDSVRCSDLVTTVCKDNLVNGTFCPTSHPFACNEGAVCAATPWKPLTPGTEDCDGGLVTRSSTCCPSLSVACRASAGYKCRNNIAFGYMCPSSNPYPCANGKRCAKSAFKPTSGSDSDCDGQLLDEQSVCCPASNVVDCNGDQRYQCKMNPPTKGVVYVGADLDDRFNFLDFRKECISPLVHTHPLKVEGRAITTYLGKAVTCSGRSGSTYYKECHEYDKNKGWQDLKTVSAGRFAAALFVTDAGTTEEKLHFAGGYNAANGWSSTVQSLSGTESFTGQTWTLPVAMYDSDVAPVDAERLVMYGGRWRGPQVNTDTPMQDVWVFYRSNTTWIKVASTASCTGYKAAAFQGKLYLPCHGTTKMVIVDLTTYSTATQENFVMSLNLLNPAMLVTGNDLFLVARVYPSGGSDLIAKYEDGQVWKQITSVAFTVTGPGRPLGALILDDDSVC